MSYIRTNVDSDVYAWRESKGKGIMLQVNMSHARFSDSAQRAQVVAGHFSRNFIDEVAYQNAFKHLYDDHYHIRAGQRMGPLTLDELENILYMLHREGLMVPNRAFLNIQHERDSGKRWEVLAGDAI